MGLFHILGSIAKAIPGPIGSAFSAHDSKKAIGHANDATQLGITNAKGDLSSQLATSMEALSPYATAGTDALSGIRDLTGLNGNAASGTAIDALHSSPLFTALFNTGRDSILAAGSATGGLRGGNVNDALYKNGQQTLAQVIQQHLQDLGGLSAQGLGATEFGANLGAGTASAIGQLDIGSGQSNAGAILGKQGVDNTFYSGLRQAIEQAAMAGAGGAPGAGSGSFMGSFGGSSPGASGGGFDLSAALKSLGGLSAVPGGGLTNATGGNGTGYKY